MRKLIGAVLFVVVLAGIAVGVLALIQAQSQPLPEVQAKSAGNHVTLSLQTFPFDPYEDQAWIDKNVTGKTLDGEAYPTAIGDHPDWVKYWPTTNLVVPAHSLVTIKIYNYDGATPLLNNFYAAPQGTVDPATGQASNQMLVDGTLMTNQDPANVSHTFTIHSIPKATQDWLYVSVPVTADTYCDPSQPNVKPPDCSPVDDKGMPDTPVVTEFSFMTGSPGDYIWQCFDPCGSNFNGFGGPMSTKGYMSGTLKVV
jgi:hypothetical protein